MGTRIHRILSPARRGPRRARSNRALPLLGAQRAGIVAGAVTPFALLVLFAALRAVRVMSEPAPAEASPG